MKNKVIQSKNGNKFTSETIYNMNLWQEFLEERILKSMIQAHKEKAPSGFKGHLKKLKLQANVRRILDVLHQVDAKPGISPEDLTYLKELFDGVKEIQDFVDNKLQQYQQSSQTSTMSTELKREQKWAQKFGPLLSKVKI